MLLICSIRRYLDAYIYIYIYIYIYTYLSHQPDRRTDTQLYSDYTRMHAFNAINNTASRPAGEPASQELSRRRPRLLLAICATSVTIVAYAGTIGSAPCETCSEALRVPRMSPGGSYITGSESPSDRDRQMCRASETQDSARLTPTVTRFRPRAAGLVPRILSQAGSAPSPSSDRRRWSRCE